NSTVRFRGEVAGSDMPEQFVIVTAYATTGENWTDMRNAAANERLRCELEQRAKWMREVTGYSPCDGHAEPGWAVDLGELEALALGRAFLQDAIFVVRQGELFVLSCAEDGEERSLGQFLARVDSAVEDASTGHGQHDCAHTIADADAGIAGKEKRAGNTSHGHPCEDERGSRRTHGASVTRVGPCPTPNAGVPRGSAATSGLPRAQGRIWEMSGFLRRS
ncbi:MAG: hypothetical protein RL354_2011, partial [Planctomycetota bacterium]